MEVTLEKLIYECRRCKAYLTNMPKLSGKRTERANRRKGGLSPFPELLYDRQLYFFIWR